MISPGGFERYCERASELFAAAGPPDLEALGAIDAEHGLELDRASVPRLMEEHGLRLRSWTLVLLEPVCELIVVSMPSPAGGGSVVGVVAR